MSKEHLRRGRDSGSRRGSPGGKDIRVLVVDDYAFVRAGLRTMLESENGIQVMADIKGGGTTTITWAGPPPDVAVMSVLAARGSIQAISQVKARWADTRVLALIPAANEEALLATIRAGASGCVPADVSTSELAHAVRSVAAGQSLIDPAMIAPVIEDVRRRRQTIEEKLARLSLDEQRVLGLLVQGQTNREIAQGLGISLATVKKRVSSILSKLEMRHRAEAAAYLAQQQLSSDG
jgi:two-component system, NarL family, response regulator DevR